MNWEVLGYLLSYDPSNHPSFPWVKDHISRRLKYLIFWRCSTAGRNQAWTNLDSFLLIGFFHFVDWPLTRLFSSLRTLEMFTFQETFRSFNYILLLHGATSYVFVGSWWHHPRRLFLIEVVTCIGFVLCVIPSIIRVHSNNFTKLQEEFVFSRVFSLVDWNTWIVSTVNTHIIGLVYLSTLRQTLKLLVTISQPDVQARVKVFFDASMAIMLVYIYIAIPYIESNFDSYDSGDWMLMAIYCYQMTVISVEQIFVLIVMYQVKCNLGSPNLSDLRTTFRCFDLNLKIYRKVVRVFGITTIIHLFNLLLGTTFSIFTGFVEGNIWVAINEYFIWDINFLVTIMSVHCMHNASIEVICEPFCLV